MGERVKLEPPPKTGWPPPALMQDDHRGLFRWFANRLGSRRLVRESASEISGARSGVLMGEKWRG